MNPETVVNVAQDAAQKSSNPFYTALGVAFFVFLIYLFIRRKRKKKTSSVKKTLADSRSSVSVTTSKRVPSKRYSDDPSLMSIAKFQKVVYDRFVSFDLETTGLDSDVDRIVEIGAVRVVKSKIVDSYQCLVNPGISMPAAATERNHITDDMLAGAPSIGEVLPDFLRFVGDDVLAAHNAGYDAAFLRSACSECRLDPPEKFFDTMRLSVYWPNLPNRKLETFIKAAGIKNKNAHRALGDADAAANLIIKSFEKLK